ncbi:hypothetical protein BDY21DRAFT_18808 [Lineolata rhizophorae]|uniref:Uncharacterized protein n=1 Tax=Lineolata rhizophorae TaxID=578093 RepID=A0A6A6P276_9PEZI|nr:hypothetical protein BDY21DRAFT_18808 [Lineolata rhizophorae]
MCVTELNVSLLPCRHRWYRFQESCAPGRNLSNCWDKLKLSGWENRVDHCPFCSSETWPYDTTIYRLLGNDRTPSVGGFARSESLSLAASTASTVSWRPSPSDSDSSRRGSLARTDSSASITMFNAGEKNRAQNLRLDAYLSSNPDKLLQLDRSASVSFATDEQGPSPPGSSASSALDAPPDDIPKAKGFIGRVRSKKMLGKLSFK